MKNPTLVAHGLARRARFHLWAVRRTTGKPVPLADLYDVTETEARAAGRALARRHGCTIMLGKNPPYPHSFAHHAQTGKRVAVNPCGTEPPAAGERWRNFASGETARILSAHGGVVTLLDSKGNRERIPLAEFRATWRKVGAAPRTNAKRMGRKPNPVTGPRWVFAKMVEAPYGQPGVTVPEGEIVAEIREHGFTTKDADRMQAALSKKFGVEIGSYITRATNPSRSTRARRSRAKVATTRRRLGRRVYRASLKALRRPAAPGNAAQSLYYLQHKQVRSAMRKAGLRGNPKGPKTVRAGVTILLTAAGFDQLAREVRGGKVADPIDAVRLALSMEHRPLHRSKLEAAMKLLESVPERLRTSNPNRRNPSRSSAARARRGALKQTRSVRGRRAGRPGARGEFYRAASKARDRRRISLAAVSDRIYRESLLSPNPRAAFVAGERVHVPYSGRSKRLTSEKATVLGETTEGVHVQVRHGKRLEDHYFQPEQIRRVAARGERGEKRRIERAKGRLTLKAARAQRKTALAAASHHRHEAECAEAMAKQTQPYAGEAPSAEYKRLRSAILRHHREADAQESLAQDLERLDPRHTSRPDPFAIANPKGGRAQNPKRPKSDTRRRAEQTLSMWQSREDREIRPRARRIHGPPRRLPDTMVKLGELVSLTYDSNKFAGSDDNPDGRRQLYEHTTRRPRPVLATDPDGRDVHIIGGKMRVTADGLVN